MFRLLACVTFLVVTAPAQAQAADQQTSAAKKKSGERMVCQSVEQVGSRLASKRVCMTAQQWEDQRRLDRENTEGSQRQTFHPPSG